MSSVQELCAPVKESTTSSTPCTTHPSQVRLAPYIWSVLLTALYYAPLFHPKNLLRLGDFYDYHIPNRIYTHLRFATGHLPQWTEGIFGGFPLLSDPQAAVFYPLNLLLGLFPQPERLDLLYFVPVLMALPLGAVFLARSLGVGAVGAVVSALVVSFNGYVVLHLGHINILETIALGLWGSGCLARALSQRNLRWSAAAGLCFSSGVLAGHPQASLQLYYTVSIGSALYALHTWRRERSARAALHVVCLAALALGTGLLGAGVQIFPTAQLLAQSTRAKLTLAESLACSLPLKQIYVVLFPCLYQPLLWRTDPTLLWLGYAQHWGNTDPWECMFYMGIVAFALGLFGWLLNWKRWHAQALFWGSIFIVLCSLGSDGYVYPWLFHHAPGFAQSRIPPRLLWLAFVLWGLLAGMGVDAASSRRFSPKQKQTAAKAACTALALTCLPGVWFLFHARLQKGSWLAAFDSLLHLNPAFQLEVNLSAQHFVTDVFLQLLLGTFLAGLCMLWMACAAGLGKLPPRLLALGAAAMLFCELWLYGYHKNIGPEPEGHVYPTQQVYRKLAKENPGRVLITSHPPSVCGVDMAMAEGVRYAGGYNPILLRWVEPYLPYGELSLLNAKENLARLNLWNVTHVLFPSINLAKSNAFHELGWVALDRDGKQHPKKIAWDAPTSQPVERLLLLSTGDGVLGLPTNIDMGYIVLYGPDGLSSQSLPIRLGIETAEWSYKSPRHTIKPAHSLPRRAIVRPVNPAFFPQGRFYIAHYDLPQSQPVSRVEVRANLTSPTALLVSHLALGCKDTTYVLPAIEGLGWKPVETGDPHWLAYKRPGALGDTWMVPEARMAKDDPSTLVAQLLATNPRRCVLISPSQLSGTSLTLANAPKPKEFSGKVTARKNRRPERLRYETESNQDGWLVLSQSYYPGWSATVDNRPTPLLQANGAHCALAVPAGKHSVKVEFRTPGLLPGAMLSLLTWAACAACILRPRRILLAICRKVT